MSRALVVAAAEDALQRIVSWIEPEGVSCTSAMDEQQAIVLLTSRDFELCVINAPACGGESLALTAAKSGAGTILLVPKGFSGAMSLAESGVAVLERPVSRGLFRQALRLMNASRRHVESYRSEVFRLRAQLDETKLIDRAKCVLIQYLGIGEQDAHRYIEKQAMDMRLTRSEIAENILKTYES